MTCILFGTFLGRRFIAKFSIFCIACSFLLSFFFSFKVFFFGHVIKCLFFSWISCGLFSCNFGFCFDSLSIVILFLVTLISILVHIYSTSYIVGDPHFCRFIGFLSLFTFFIVLLVISDNFLLLFVGWEGVGLCSYLLINFWYTRIQANKAAIKAIIINRVGDFGLVLGVIFLFSEVGSLEYSTVFSTFPLTLSSSIVFFGFNFSSSDLIVFFIFIGAVGKSAQIGLHTWLPDAMEGPTPVSALIHSATMVTAGVFLLIRCSFLFEFCPNILWFISFIGGITAFFSAVIGVFQNDLKKVIAYSTCSQLGYLVFACGLSCYNVSFFHLINHGFFKALLFLTAGGLIHAANDEQDIRKFGGIVRFLPFSFSIIVVGSLALIGFPFLSGFYSKELILETSYSQFYTVSHFVYFCGLFSAFFTSFYSLRSIYLIFFSIPRGQKRVFETLKEVSFPIFFSLFSLSIFSLFSGFLIKEAFVGLSSPFLVFSIFSHPQSYVLLDAEFLPVFIKSIPLLFSFAGVFLGICIFFFYNRVFYFLKVSFFGRYVYSFFNRKWFFDKLYAETISQPFFCLCYNSVYISLDKGLFELFGPFGFSSFIIKKKSTVSFLHTGYIHNYSFILLFSFFLFSILFYFNFINFFNGFLFLFFCFLLFFGGVAQWFRVLICQVNLS